MVVTMARKMASGQRGLGVAVVNGQCVVDGVVEEAERNNARSPARNTPLPHTSAQLSSLSVTDGGQPPFKEQRTLGARVLVTQPPARYPASEGAAQCKALTPSFL